LRGRLKVEHDQPLADLLLRGFCRDLIERRVPEVISGAQNNVDIVLRSAEKSMIATRAKQPSDSPGVVVVVNGQPLLGVALTDSAAHLLILQHGEVFVGRDAKSLDCAFPVFVILAGLAI